MMFLKVIWPLALAAALVTMTLVMADAFETAVTSGLATAAILGIATLATLIEDAHARRAAQLPTRGRRAIGITHAL